MTEGEDVHLYVYDLSGGLASRLSPVLIGKQVEGIWHTGIVVFGREYYFGSGGVCIAEPGSVIGEPLKKINLGKTFIPKPVFDEYLRGLSESEFRSHKYDIIRHNCNNFSDTLSNFLVGSSIPSYILDLPEEILNSKFGQAYQGLINSTSTDSSHLETPNTVFNREPSPEFYQLNTDIEAARYQSLLLSEKRNAIYEKLAKRERKKNKKGRREAERSGVANGLPTMSSEADGGEVVGEESNSVLEKHAEEASRRLTEELAEEEKREREERRKNREPPIVFKDAVDIHIEFDALVGLIDGKLSEEEQQSLEELHKYMLEDEGSWALGDSFLMFIGRLLTDSNLEEAVSIKALLVLAAAALKDDVILLLHQDRKHHVLMNYAYDVDRLSLAQQRALTLFLCNLFENSGSSEWLMYISEWPYNCQQLSNIRVTTKVAVNALLSEDEELRDRGTAMVYNLATKEKLLKHRSLRALLPRGSASKVFDDIAVELTMAVLQYFSGNPGEAQTFRCLKALLQFCQVSVQDVPQLVQMIGPHPSKFKGQSERNDQLIQLISARLR